MAKLTDTHTMLLAQAAARPDGSLVPPPDTLGPVTARIARAVATLIARSLATEVAVETAERAWRHEGDRHWGAVVTDAGRAAIGAAPVPTMATEATEPAPPPASAPTKTARVLDLLARPDGATLAELVAATGWLPHTTRAALTGLRKKGHAITRDRRGDVSCYKVAA